MKAELSEIQISEVNKKDLIELTELTHANGGSRRFSASYIDHCYFNNPSQSYSFWKATSNDKIEGYATTNNFLFNLDGNESGVAMPQNLLTSKKYRGKGVFQLLYQKVELDNFNNKNVNCFLTFTNALSTPIFLNKFGYLRGKCPKLLVSVFSPAHLLLKIKYKRIDDLESIQTDNFFQFNNSLLKSNQYYQWRYGHYEKDKLHALTVFKNERMIGYAFLISNKKKGLPFLMLTDIICGNPKELNDIVDACKKYSARHFYAMMMMFDLEGNVKRGLTTIAINNRFNFLVKGKTSEETLMLSEKTFNLFLGDTDFI